MREIRRLQGCINDLIGVVGLSAMWGDEPQEIARALLNVLTRRLKLEFAAARLSGDSPIRLFDAFFSTKRDGMGLGLSISRNIIQAHGGELSVARNASHGLTMTFSLPSDGQTA